MSDNQNAIQSELKYFDSEEAAQVQEARDNGFSESELAIAQADIADERLLVEQGVESGQEAVDNLNVSITDDLLGGNSDDEFGEL